MLIADTYITIVLYSQSRTCLCCMLLNLNFQLGNCKDTESEQWPLSNVNGSINNEQDHLNIAQLSIVHSMCSFYIDDAILCKQLCTCICDATH